MLDLYLAGTIFHIEIKNTFLKTIIIKHDWEEASLSQISTTLIQFADCDTEFLKQIAYKSNIKRVTVTTCIDNQCQTTACKQDT